MRKDFCEEVLRQCGKLAVIPFFFEPTSMESYFVYFMDHHGNCFAVPFCAENFSKTQEVLFCERSSDTGHYECIMNAKGEIVHGDARSDVKNSKHMAVATCKKWLELNN